MPELSQSETQNDLLQRQAAASRALTTSVTFVDMAGNIAQHMPLEAGQFIEINHLIYDLNSQVFRLQTLAWATPHQADTSAKSLEIPLGGSGYPLEEDAEGYASINVRQVQTDAKLNSDYQKWLMADQIVSLAGFPIRFAGHLVGLLTVNSRSEAVNLSAEVGAQYQLLANQLGALIQVNNLNMEVSFRQELIERQSRTFAELTVSMSLDEMAATVAKYMLPTRGRFLGISEIVYDAEGNINGWQILTSANRDRVYDWRDTPVMPWANIAPAVQQSMLACKAFVMPSIQYARPDENSPELHALLAAIHVESYVNIPMFVEDKPFASLLVMSRTPNVFTQDEINAFTNLGDQMSALIHSSRLLKEAQETQILALQLVETNRNITLTNNMDDIGQALLTAMPASVTGLTIALFSRPIQARERPTNLETVVLANHNGVHKLGKIDRLSGDTPGLNNTVRALENNEIVILNSQSTSKVALPPQSLAALYADGASMITVIGLQAGPKLIGLLGLASNEALDKTPQQGANLRAIADQIGITLENRSLLAQTTETLNLVQMQFETSNTIYRSTNPGEILEAIYRFTGATYQRAMIGLIEPESNPAMLRVTAEIRDGKTALVDEVVPLDMYPAHQTLKSLETLYVPDVTTDSYLSDAERTMLIDQHIDSMLVVPMVVNANFVGLLAFMNRIHAASSTTSMRALRHMADLAAVVVENRSLLQITGQSLEETQLLYEINRAILGAQDTLDVLRVIREMITPDAAAITELSVTYNEAQQMDDMIVNYMNTPEGEQAVQIPLKDMLGRENLDRLQHYWNANRSVITIVEDLATSDRDYPISEFLRTSGARSFVNIVMRQGDRVQQMISMSFPEARHFSAAQRRLYISLSDQIGIVMQNHRLLREAQLSAGDLTKRVGQLQGINQVSARILRASDEMAMVKETSEALVKLLGIDHCGITLVDPAHPDYLIVAGEYPSQGALNARLPLKNNPMWEALQKRNFQPLYISSREDALIEPATREILNNMGVFSLGIVPIVANNKIIGGVGLDMNSPAGRITPEMLELAQILVVPLNIGLQNLRLLANIQSSADRFSEQVDTLRNLQQIEANISAAQDETTLLKQSVRDLTDLLKADHCGIVLLDPSMTIGTVVSEYPEHGALGIQFTVAGNPLYAFIRGDNYDPVVIHDIETDPILDEENRTFLRSVGAKAMIVLPLVVQDKVIGSVGVDLFSSAKTISPEMIDIAQTVSSQIAIAVQNRRLVSEAERRAAQLQRIAIFNQKVQTTLDISRTLEIVLEEADQMLPQNQMSISLFDKADQQLKVVAQRTDNGLSLSPDDGDVIPLTGYTQTVWEKAEPLYIPDLRAVRHDMDVGVTLRSWLLVPVVGRTGVLGIVSVGSDQAFAYSEADIGLFSQLVKQFGVLLENVDAYRQNQKTARNESLVNDISAQLQRQLDIQGMLNITAAELGKAIGARRARIRLATSIPETDPQSSAE